MANEDQKSEERWIDAAERRVIIPASDMTVHRWMHDPAIAFPKPTKFSPNGRNYWWLPAIRQWERDRAAATKKRRVPLGARPAQGDSAHIE
jgi:hypothetical protein